MEVNKSRFSFLSPEELLKQKPASMNPAELKEFETALRGHLTLRKETKGPEVRRKTGWANFFPSDTTALDLDRMIQRVEIARTKKHPRGTLRFPRAFGPLKFWRRRR